MQDAESVRRQQQAHGQQHSCTLDECFQLYTKEEQVRAPPGTAHPGTAPAMLTAAVGASGAGGGCGGGRG